MKKLSSSITNMVIILTLIAIIAGGILAYVNSATKQQIENINKEKLNAGIKEVMGGGDVKTSKPDTLKKVINNKNKIFVVYDVSSTSNEPIGKAVETTENGFGGDLKVLVGFDNEGTILGYTILKHTETPGLGAKANVWFKNDYKKNSNIIGKNPGECNFTVRKDGGDIDAITASTITSRAFLLSIQNAYDEISKEQVDGKSGATEQTKSQNQ